MPICCRVHTDEGIYGDGEAGIAYGTGIPRLRMVVDMAHHIIGQDPMNTEFIWETIFKAPSGARAAVSSCSPVCRARYRADGHQGQGPGRAVYQLLGGKCRDELRCYASQLQFGWTTKIGPWGTNKEYVDIVLHAVSEGYDAVKIDFTTYDEKGKNVPHLDKEGFVDRKIYKRVEGRMAAIREEFPDIDIIVENHCQTDLTSAIRIGELCDKYDMMAYENPSPCSIPR
jgi:L-alanine-DL-glutamate epimerase-like enolase superfamily enzyme